MKLSLANGNWVFIFLENIHKTTKSDLIRIGFSYEDYTMEIRVNN